LRQQDTSTLLPEVAEPNSVLGFRPIPSSQASFTSTGSFDGFQKALLANETASPLNTLEYGLLALRLLPEDCKSVFIFLTDGVTSGFKGGDFMYREASRRMARLDVAFTVIQGDLYIFLIESFVDMHVKSWKW
jgi:hypothetical protein